MEVYERVTADRAAPSLAQADNTFSRTVLEKVKGILSIVGDAHQELAMLGERQFGGVPGNPSGAGKTEPPPPVGRCGEILDLLERVETRAQLVANQAGSLNARL